MDEGNKVVKEESDIREVDTSVLYRPDSVSQIQDVFQVINPDFCQTQRRVENPRNSIGCRHPLLCGHSRLSTFMLLEDHTYAFKRNIMNVSMCLP